MCVVTATAAGVSAGAGAGASAASAGSAAAVSAAAASAAAASAAATAGAVSIGATAAAATTAAATTAAATGATVAAGAATGAAATQAALVPLLVASTLMSVAGSAVSYVSQQQAADSQADFMKKMYSKTGKESRQAYDNHISQIQNAIGQQFQAASDQAVATSVNTAQGRGRATTLLGERGITGGTVGQLMADFTRHEAISKMNLATNYGWQVDQAGSEMKGARSGAQSNINQATPRPVQQPSPFALALQVGGSLMEGYDRTQFYTKTGPYAADGGGGGLTRPVYF